MTQTQDTRTQDAGSIVEIHYSDGTVVRQGETGGGLAPQATRIDATYSRNVLAERRGMTGVEILILLAVALGLTAMLAAFWYKTEADRLNLKVEDQKIEIHRLEGGLLYGE